MKIFEKLRQAAKPFCGMLLAGLVLTACKKDDFNNGNIRTPAAGFMAFNLAPDQEAVGISLSGRNLNNASLNYTSYTGAYLPVYVGSREVRSFDYATGNTIAISSNNFADSSYYSAFVIGKAGNYRNLVVRDPLDSLTASTGKAWVRYVNAIADSSTVPTISIGVSGENLITEQAPFSSLSAFRHINAGAVIISVTAGSAFSANRTIALEENKIYTVLFTGDPMATDSTKNVQIKFIQNGTLKP